MKLSHFIYAVLGLMALTMLTTLVLSFTADHEQQTKEILGAGFGMFMLEFFLLLLGGVIVDTSGW